MNDMPEGPSVVPRIECECRWHHFHKDKQEYFCHDEKVAPDGYGRRIGPTMATPVEWCPLMHKLRVAHTPKGEDHARVP